MFMQLKISIYKLNLIQLQFNSIIIQFYSIFIQFFNNVLFPINLYFSTILNFNDLHFYAFIFLAFIILHSTIPCHLHSMSLFFSTFTIYLNYIHSILCSCSLLHFNFVCYVILTHNLISFHFHVSNWFSYSSIFKPPIKFISYFISISVSSLDLT